jgi:hypothetical protein
MRNMIRNLMLATAVVATAAFVTTSAKAATLNVPFSFTVNGKICPAGEYSVERAYGGNVVSVTNRDGSRNFTWVLRPGDPDPTSTTVSLYFENQGETHVLESVQYKSQVASAMTKKSKRMEYPVVTVSAGEGR